MLYFPRTVVYVGMATVGAAAWWFMFYEGGPLVSFHQLVRKTILLCHNYYVITYDVFVKQFVMHIIFITCPYMAAGSCCVSKNSGACFVRPKRGTMFTHGDYNFIMFSFLFVHALVHALSFLRALSDASHAMYRL